jgi:hypothetical protein
MSVERSVAVPWGPDGSLHLELPQSDPFSRSSFEIVWPDNSNPISDYIAALEAALDSPVDAPTLEHQLGPGATVAIVVDDPSRWTPVPEALPVLLRRLHAVGVKPEDVTISIGVGRHAVVDADAMRRRVGASIATGYRCFSPPLDDRSQYADLGRTEDGVPVRVFRPVALASLRILIGSVLPHLQAGFGGGYKLILPGTSHRSTLGTLHRQGLEDQSGSSGLLGDPAAGNPMRRAIRAAAQRLGPCWSISHLLGGRGEVFRIITGDPERVQELLAAEAKNRFQAPPSPPVDLLVAGNAPWPGDPMQSFKVLLHHRTACRPGGVLAGLFWTDPDEIDRSFPIAPLRRIAATGSAGGWTIRCLLPVAQQIARVVHSPAVFMLHWARELVVDRTVLVYAPPLHDRIGPRLGPVHLFADQAALWKAAAEALTRHQSRFSKANRNVEPIRGRVFPQGGLTYVAQSHGLGCHSGGSMHKDGFPAPQLSESSIHVPGRSL